MSFRGDRVFVEVDERGELVLEDGRARMRYRADDRRVYRPWPSNLEPLEDGPVETKQEGSPNASDHPDPSATIVVYTDGACLGNPGPAGLGYYLELPDGNRLQRGEPLGRATNNIAELTAISRALELIDDRRDARVLLHTDSEYAIGLLTRGWKAKANRELIERIRRRVARFPLLELRKVRGHAGVPQNELVDRLARAAAESQSAVDE
ncbi:MAG: ribonuclease H [Polyangia bacterium]